MAEKEQYYNGVKFTKDEKTGYYLNSTLRIRMHRYVWLCEKGDIPKGYEIHHIDFDKSNNDISNLQCLTKSEHKKIHAELLTDERREWFRNNLNENARPKAIEWHKSEKGREWHKEHYENMKEALHAKKEFECEMCGKKYESEARQGHKFCSNACKSKWRRINKVDCIDVKCPICGGTFKTNKFKPSVTCSRSCANRYRSLPS